MPLPENTIHTPVSPYPQGRRLSNPFPPSQAWLRCEILHFAQRPRAGNPFPPSHA